MPRETVNVSIHFTEGEMSVYIQRVLLASEAGSRYGYVKLHEVQEEMIEDCRRKLYDSVKDADRTDAEKVDFAYRTSIRTSDDVFNGMLYQMEGMINVDDESKNVFLKPSADTYRAHYLMMEDHVSSLGELMQYLAEVFEGYLDSDYVPDTDKRTYRTLAFYLNFPDAILSMPEGDRAAVGEFFRMHIGDNS